MSLKYYSLSALFALLAMCLLPAVANNYVYPSDIAEQSEQYQYRTEREDRYAGQREWAYPKAFKESDSESYYSNTEQYLSNDNYPAPERQQFQNKTNRYYSGDRQVQYLQNQPDYYDTDKQDLFGHSEHYKYSNFGSNSPGLNKSEAYRYPEQEKSGYNYISQSDAQGNNYPALSRPARHIRQKRYNRPYPQLLYPSDMEAKTRFAKRNKYSRDYEPSYRDDRKIQYVPVPVYSVPGTLPGTVPGVVTPGSMVPGYSHLSPNKNNLNPFLGLQYNPMSAPGLFPEGGNPFDSFYKTYGNHSKNMSPFASPESMFPGLSIPNLFSSQ